jgi:hypothetical protein
MKDPAPADCLSGVVSPPVLTAPAEGAAHGPTKPSGVGPHYPMAADGGQLHFPRSTYIHIIAGWGGLAAEPGVGCMVSGAGDPTDRAHREQRWWGATEEGPSSGFHYVGLERICE